MKTHMLLAWIGHKDLEAARGKSTAGLGPIGRAVKNGDYTHVFLLSDYKAEDEKRYSGWIKTQTQTAVEVYHYNLTSPTDYGQIYERACDAIEKIRDRFGTEVTLTFHLSPGTPAMAAVWIILAKTRYPAQLIQSSKERGVEAADVPFDIAADYLPPLDQKREKNIIDLTEGLPPESADFGAIICQSQIMKQVIAQAQRIAGYDVPVIIQGETGTGKELLARAIHSASKRQGKAFVPLNCGAIAEGLVDAELFGYGKGAFTGAQGEKTGILEAANGGTVFLDEIGELSLAAQVKLLRAVQEKKVRRVGETEEREIDIRIIAATNRNLKSEIAAKRFREDLFHRLAVGVLTLPPLRERHGDLNLLIDHNLKRINDEFAKDGNWRHKKLSAGARNLLLLYSWPGNIRELFNVMSRAVIWTPSTIIEAEHIDAAMLRPTDNNAPSSDILNRRLGKDLKLSDIMAEVSRHYLKKTLAEAKGNKTKAAELVGLSNYQTFTNWMKKYGVE